MIELLPREEVTTKNRLLELASLLRDGESERKNATSVGRLVHMSLVIHMALSPMDAQTLMEFKDMTLGEIADAHGIANNRKRDFISGIEWPKFYDTD